MANGFVVIFFAKQVISVVQMLDAANTIALFDMQQRKRHPE